jgi:glycine cleavage system H protein
MNVPANIRCALTDEWALLEGDVATIGVTDYAQHELGEIVYIELPEPGAEVSRGVAFGVLESVKAVADLNSPVGGQVLEVNAPLRDDASPVNDSPYEGGWLIKVRVANPEQLDDLMDAAAYAEYRGL